MRSSTKNVSIEFETKKGEIHSMGVRIPVAEIQPSELVAPYQKVFDKIIDLELKDKSITCRRGCGACCRQLIPLSIPEAFFLRDMIKSLPRDQQAEIGRKFDSISQAMDHAGLSSGSAHALKTKNIDQVYFKLGIPCPFLENEQCSIYEHRPLVCRDYYVESSAENCKNPYIQELKKIKIERNVGSLIAAYSFRLYNMPKIPVPLSRVPVWTKGHTALRAAKWPGEMMFQTIIDYLNRVPCANSNINTIRIRLRNTSFKSGKGEPNTRSQAALEREKRILASAFNGDAAQLRKVLGHPGADSIINAVDRKGRSGLFIALSRGYAATRPEVITAFLKNGAIIKNGTISAPDQLPKLLTQHANALIIKRIFKDFFGTNGNQLSRNLIVEVGSGSGYLKYLLSLLNDPSLSMIQNRIVETESSPDIVRRNAVCGKSTIRGSIRNLPELFGKSFTSCVVSLNVMDIFPPHELITNMRAIYELLGENGVLLHIMSSAIHPDIFEEIEETYPNDMLYPYYSKERLGLRMISKNHGNELLFNTVRPSENPCDLFIRNPEEYVQLADSVTAMVKQHKLDDRTILFKDHFISKLTDAFRKTGFRLIYNDLMTASAMVKRNRFHSQVPDFNCFENIMGVLLPASDDSPDRQLDEIKEKSTFLVMAGQKMPA